MIDGKYKLWMVQRPEFSKKMVPMPGGSRGIAAKIQFAARLVKSGTWRLCEHVQGDLIPPSAVRKMEKAIRTNNQPVADKIVGLAKGHLMAKLLNPVFALLDMNIWEEPKIDFVPSQSEPGKVVAVPDLTMKLRYFIDEVAPVRVKQPADGEEPRYDVLDPSTMEPTGAEVPGAIVAPGDCVAVPIDNEYQLPTIVETEECPSTITNVESTGGSSDAD